MKTTAHIALRSNMQPPFRPDSVAPLPPSHSSAVVSVCAPCLKMDRLQCYPPKSRIELLNQFINKWGTRTIYLHVARKCSSSCRRGRLQIYRVAMKGLWRTVASMGHSRGSLNSVVSRFVLLTNQFMASAGNPPKSWRSSKWIENSESSRAVQQVAEELQCLARSSLSCCWATLGQLLLLCWPNTQ